MIIQIYVEAAKQMDGTYSTPHTSTGISLIQITAGLDQRLWSVDVPRELQEAMGKLNGFKVEPPAIFLSCVFTHRICI